MEYLIVRCEELYDQYECDADRTIICATNNPEKYEDRYGYEIYERKPDNTYELIKDYRDGD